jgi:L-iditol 2-dehydrogenase
MGLMNAAVARAYGAHPIIVAGMTPHRLEIAARHYADATVDVRTDDLQKAASHLTQGRGADVVIVAVSSERAVETGLAVLRPGGVLNAFAGVPKGTTILLDLHGLHYKQWHLTGSFGTGPGHMQKALTLLAGGQVDAGPLVTATFAFDRTDEAIRHAMEFRGLKAVVLFDRNREGKHSKSKTAPSREAPG